MLIIPAEISSPYIPRGSYTNHCLSALDVTCKIQARTNALCYTNCPIYECYANQLTQLTFMKNGQKIVRIELLKSFIMHEDEWVR